MLTTEALAGSIGPKQRRRKRLPPAQRRSSVAFVVIIVVAAFSSLPVLWMVITSFTAPQDIFQFPPAIFHAFSIANFQSVIGNPTLMRFMLNGLFVSFTTAALSIAIGFLAGYSFSKFRYRGRRWFLYIIFVAQMVPSVLLLVTLYSSFNSVHLLNTYTALVLAYTTFTLPLSVWMMKNTFDTLPSDLIEAGRIDGAGEWRIMSRIVLPVTLTSLIAVGLFAFIQAWNDLVFALTLVNTPKQTLPAGLTLTYLGEFQSSYGPMMAASLITSIPVLAIFLILQKHFVSGALSGAVK